MAKPWDFYYFCFQMMNSYINDDLIINNCCLNSVN